MTTKQLKSMPILQGITSEAMLDAHTRLAAARAAIPPATLHRVNYDLGRAATAALEVVQGLPQDVRGELAARTDWDDAKLAALSDSALAALHAERATAMAVGRGALDGSLETVKEAAGLRETLRAQLEVIEKLSLPVAEELRRLRLGRGRATLALDLSHASAAFARHWDALGTRRVVTRDEVDRAGAMFAAVTTAVRRLDAKPGTEEADDRVRAAHVLLTSYVDLQGALAFVCKGEARALAPSLFVASRRRALRRAPAGDAPSATPAVAPAPNGDGSAAPATAPAAPLAPVAAPHGSPAPAAAPASSPHPIA